jgi:hypothetical protein
MKKLSFVAFTALLALFSFNGKLQAQSSSSDKIIFEKESFSKSVSNMSDADRLALENIKLASGKAYQDFTTRFKGATNINMSEGKNAIFISCSTDGDFNRITYNRKGRWQHTVRTYENQKLPEDVREQVEYAYPRFAIFGGVIEVHSSNKVAYLVTIEDKKSWKRIRVVDGETDVYEEYKKSQ